MKVLDKVTLVLVDTVNYGNAVNSLQKSLSQIRPARTIFFTDIDIDLSGLGIEVIKISEKINSKRTYSEFIIKKLGKYIETDYVLVTQWDGYVLNGDAWNDDFYNYSFIGAAWLYVDERNVGNGGFSLRSKKLQDILMNDDFIQVCDPEDEVIGRLYRNYLEEKYGLSFPTNEVADSFSFELRAPVYDTFGFHGNFHEPFQKTVMITRKGAMGDVIALEPVLHYFHKKGFRVVLNTLQPFFNLFVQHYFKVHHPRELDERIEYKEYNLDMAYEVQPKRLHLDSYYEMCDVPEAERVYRNPRLSMAYNPRENRLFYKYVVIHNDVREQASRNITGINWAILTHELKKKGFSVFQIGVGKHDQIPGATYMATPSEPMLMWIVGGADMFIGIDSGPSHIAISFEVPSIIFYGSVNPQHLIPDLKNVISINNHDGEGVCEEPFCWSNTIGCVGTKCYIDDEKPPCNAFDTNEVISAINSLIKKQKDAEAVLAD